MRRTYSICYIKTCISPSAQHAVYFRTIGEIWNGIWDVALKDLHRPGKPSCWGSSYHAWGLLQKSLGNRSEICGKSCGNPFCHKNIPFESRILLANRWDIISNDFLRRKKEKAKMWQKLWQTFCHNFLPQLLPPFFLPVVFCFFLQKPLENYENCCTNNCLRRKKEENKETKVVLPHIGNEI